MAGKLVNQGGGVDRCDKVRQHGQTRPVTLLYLLQKSPLLHSVHRGLTGNTKMSDVHVRVQYFVFGEG